MDLTVENICYPHLFFKPFKSVTNGGVTLLFFFSLNLLSMLSIETFQSIYCPLGKRIVYKAEGSQSWYYFDYENAISKHSRLPSQL